MSVETEKRWGIAQDYEKKHWAELASQIQRGGTDLKWYRWKADRTARRMQACGLRLPDDATVAEIGSGPVGQVGFLPGSRWIALDPLMEYFEKSDALLMDRPPKVEYLCSKGESLPLGDRSCDLVIIDNCLDHCENPTKVLEETNRILKLEGHLYLTLNIRSRLGFAVRRVVEATLLVDKGHPYSYFDASLRRAIRRAGFSELGHWSQPWAQSVSDEWRERRLRTIAKIGTLTLERLYEGVWAKN